MVRHNNASRKSTIADEKSISLDLLAKLGFLQRNIKSIRLKRALNCAALFTLSSSCLGTSVRE
ncbi:hypothetical protein ACTXT7_016874 [Hymenolepis weldensis]